MPPLADAGEGPKQRQKYKGRSGRFVEKLADHAPERAKKAAGPPGLGPLRHGGILPQLPDSAKVVSTL